MTLIPILQEMATKIVETINPTKIILVGYFDRSGNRHSIFDKPLGLIQEPSAVNLLVISDNSDRLRLTDSLEGHFKARCRLTLIWMFRPEYDSLVEKNNSFIISALQTGKLLYQKWKPVPRIQKTIDELQAIPVKIKELFGSYQRSMIFYQMANVQYGLGNYGMAAFCIHQTAEQLLSLLIYHAIGYRFSTHNLDKQLRLLRFHNCTAANIFAKVSSEATYRLALLMESYVSYRYRSDLVITEADIDYYLAEVNKLQKMVDRIFYPVTDRYEPLRFTMASA